MDKFGDDFDDDDYSDDDFAFSQHVIFPNKLVIFIE